VRCIVVLPVSAWFRNRSCPAPVDVIKLARRRARPWRQSSKLLLR
jgi:hypothetical protein